MSDLTRPIPQHLRTATTALSIALMATPFPSVANPLPLFSRVDLPVITTTAGSTALPEWFLLAQSTDGGGQGNQDNSGSYADRNPAAKLVVSKVETVRVVKLLSSGRDFCGGIPLLYRIDCVRYQFWKTAQTLPKNGDYAALRATLLQGADQLEAVRDANADPAGVPTQFRRRDGSAGGRPPPFIPVKPAAAAKANRAAETVITQTATLLLRSTENSDRRQASYQEIAAAIDSTKVLLRSA